MTIKAKPQPGFIPPRVIVAYARLTGTAPKYSVARDEFDFVASAFSAVTEFRKRQRHTGGLSLGAVHLNGTVVVGQIL